MIQYLFGKMTSDTSESTRCNHVLRQPTRCADEISKRSFISTVKASVHTNPSRSKTELLENVRQTGGIWKQWLGVSVWAGNSLKTELFENDDVTIITWFPWQFSPNTNPKWQAVPKFSRELGRVSNFNQSINWHHHMKDHVEIGHLT